jgi:hypothetical protein
MAPDKQGVIARKGAWSVLTHSGPEIEALHKSRRQNSSSWAKMHLSFCCVEWNHFAPKWLLTLIAGGRFRMPLDRLRLRIRACNGETTRKT